MEAVLQQVKHRIESKNHVTEHHRRDVSESGHSISHCNTKITRPRNGTVYLYTYMDQREEIQTLEEGLL